MLLDRLIRRDKPESIAYGVILSLDPAGKRALIQGQNGQTTWAAYEPSDSPNLEDGQTVAIAATSGGSFLLGRTSTALPAETTLLEI